MNILKLYIIKGAQSRCIVLNNQSPFYSPNSKTVLATGMLLRGLDQHGFYGHSNCPRGTDVLRRALFLCLFVLGQIRQVLKPEPCVSSG